MCLCVFVHVCVYVFVCVCVCVCQRRLWQLGTGQADYRSQSTPKKEMYNKIIRIYIEV